MEGYLSASQLRILIIKWVGQAWKNINVMKESIIRTLKRCSFSVALDGSENAQVSIDSIPNYEMPQQFVEEELKLLDDDEMRMEIQVKTMKMTNLAF